MLVKNSSRAARAATSFRIGRGAPLPFGMHETREGYNFALFSRHATRVSLLLFESASGDLSETIDLDPAHHRTGDVWHVRLSREVRGRSYALRVEGPWDPENGHRFDPGAQLIDPYTNALVSCPEWNGEKPAAAAGKPHAGGTPRGMIVEDHFDWEDDAPPRHPWQDTIIYEAHVRGLTADPSSGVAHRGGYLGLIEKIAYLQQLGVTALELMPLQEFRDVEVDARSGRAVRNYWGYNPTALFAPKASYASRNKPEAALTEFKTAVRALHRAGIEVILDVVMNHTAEGDASGPTISFRGLDNSIYYLLEPARRRYIDYTGCGNTLNCNHPVVRSFIVDCLRHWVVHFHVDGFRFDLASILGRDTDGHLLSNPPLLEQIAEDPLLRNVKLIAEAWDLGGAFQVGQFPGKRWAEWNSCFRDDVRRFWRGDAGLTAPFATRLCGSADLYQIAQETPVNSINFVTCHDGFTLNDLVSYGRKHNEANGEDNRDGIAENHSENNGVEGPSDDLAVDSIRLRQIKNMLVTLLVSRGVPMLLGGDEFRRTQQGNNNPYCQDNAISWYDWRLVERNAGLVRFVSRLIGLRKAHPVLGADRFYTDAEIGWFGCDGRSPDWHGRDNRLGCVIGGGESRQGAVLCLMFNATLQPARFILPSPPAGAWRVVVDTAQSSPADAPDPGSQPTAGGELVLVPRSTIVLRSA
jgi:glycogen operon protein